MNDKWYEDQKDNLHEEKYHVITAAAANLIKNQVRCTNFDTDFYPLLEDMNILYNEVNQYKQFLMVNEFNLTASAAAKFTQFVRDNIDHNACTGKGTFNGMDIIVCSITQTNKAKR